MVDRKKKSEPKLRRRNVKSLPSSGHSRQSFAKIRRKTVPSEAKKGPFIDVHSWPKEQAESEVFAGSENSSRRSSFSKIVLVAERLSRKSRKPQVSQQKDHEKLWISMDTFIEKCLIFD